MREKIHTAIIKNQVKRANIKAEELIDGSFEEQYTMLEIIKLC